MIKVPTHVSRLVLFGLPAFYEAVARDLILPAVYKQDWTNFEKRSIPFSIETISVA